MLERFLWTYILYIYVGRKLSATGGIVKGVIVKQLQPIKDDLEYIKKQVDNIRDRMEGLTARLEAIEKAVETEKVAE